jgi:hypothetical protein
MFSGIAFLFFMESVPGALAVGTHASGVLFKTRRISTQHARGVRTTHTL